MTETTGWQPIATARKDRPILGLCVHGSDPYFETETRLTPYGSHCEGLSHVADGPHVLVWGGGDSEVGEYGQVLSEWPDWWFRAGSDFEETAAPTHWMDIPTTPPVSP